MQLTNIRRHMIDHKTATMRPSAIKRAVEAAYTQFEQQCPQWTESLFDRYFVMERLLPYLIAEGVRSVIHNPAQVAHLWMEQVTSSSYLRTKHVGALTPVADHFLALVAKQLPSH